MDRARSGQPRSVPMEKCCVRTSGVFSWRSLGDQGWGSIWALSLMFLFDTLDMQNQSCKDSVHVTRWLRKERATHAQITDLQFQIRIKPQIPGLKLSTLSFKDLLFRTFYFFLTYRIGSKCLFVAFTILHSLVPIICPKLYFLLLCSFRIPMCSGLSTG